MLTKDDFMRLTIAQLCIERDMERNKEKMLSILRAACSDDWIVFPEGVLSGYFPEEDGYLRDTNPSDVQHTV